MRALVTGASGFVGSYVTRHLANDGHDVAVLLRRSGRPWRIEDLLKQIRRIDGDLGDLARAQGTIAEFAPEAVIHLAWDGVGAVSRNHPAQAENITRTVALVQLAHEVGAKAWVGVGSQAEYGPTEGPIGEETPTRPASLYGVAKLAAGLFASQLCREVGMRFAWLRLFSSYGPQEDDAWMIPSLIRALLRGERPALTAGTQICDYLYVEDAARAIVQAALDPGVSGVFNLASGRARTLRSIVEQTRDAIAPGSPLGFGEIPFRPGQIMHLEADNRRLREATGWTPQVELADGLERTIAWYREESGRTSETHP